MERDADSYFPSLTHTQGHSIALQDRGRCCSASRLFLLVPVGDLQSKQLLGNQKHRQETQGEPGS